MVGDLQSGRKEGRLKRGRCRKREENKKGKGENKGGKKANGE